LPIADANPTQLGQGEKQFGQTVPAFVIFFEQLLRGELEVVVRVVDEQSIVSGGPGCD
jgi:hypothetical protein